MTTIQDPGTLAKEVDALDAESGKWSEKGLALDVLFQKKFSQLDTLKRALHEGGLEIESQTKALVEARSAFEKILVKAEGLDKELRITGKLARDMYAELDKSFPKLEKAKVDVEKLLALNKTSSLLKDAKATCEKRLKALETLLATVKADAQECEELSPLPKIPALPR